MNLNNAPTLDELKAIVRAYDHRRNHHIVYVTKSGEVGVHILESGETPAGWAERNDDLVQFRLETFAQGTGHFGEEAANSDYWTKRLYRALLDNWQKGEVDYIDEF